MHPAFGSTDGRRADPRSGSSRRTPYVKVHEGASTYRRAPAFAAAAEVRARGRAISCCSPARTTRSSGVLFGLEAADQGGRPVPARPPASRRCLPAGSYCFRETRRTMRGSGRASRVRASAPTSSRATARADPRQRDARAVERKWTAADPLAHRRGRCVGRRDLIKPRPPNDNGAPAELEDAARVLAERHGAQGAFDCRR